MLGPVFQLGLLSLWIGQMSYRLVQMLIFAKLWHGGRWQQITL